MLEVLVTTFLVGSALLSGLLLLRWAHRLAGQRS